MARAMGERRRLQPASNIGIREYFKNTKKERWKGRKWRDIGRVHDRELGLTSQTMNNQVSYIVSWVRLNSSSRAQGQQPP